MRVILCCISSQKQRPSVDEFFVVADVAVGRLPSRRQHIVQYSYQISKAMAHLSSNKVRIVPLLAAVSRNRVASIGVINDSSLTSSDGDLKKTSCFQKLMITTYNT